MFKKHKVVMLPTEKAKLYSWKDSEGNFKLSFIHDLISEKDKFRQPQHLYILSDEEIKEGDYYINLESKNIFKFQNEDEMAFMEFHYIFKKIIASTDSSLQIFVGNSLDGRTGIYGSLPRPSDSFIKKYCELGSIDEVMVEYEFGRLNDVASAGSISEGYKLKVAPDNTITIKKVKDSWNREELEEYCRKAFSAGVDKGIALYEWRNSNYSDNDSFDKVFTENKWIEENL